MHNKRRTILAINPGTRYLGVAVLKGSTLIDWSVKVINGKQPQARLNKAIELISSFLAEYQPDVLVLKKLHPSRSSLMLNLLSIRIEELTRTNSIRLAKYSIQEAEVFHSPNEKINKTNLSELICQKHPVLRHDLQREQSSLNPYYIRMFEAVALGTLVQALAEQAPD